MSKGGKTMAKDLRIDSLRFCDFKQKISRKLYKVVGKFNYFKKKPMQYVADFDYKGSRHDIIYHRISDNFECLWGNGGVREIISEKSLDTLLEKVLNE